MQFNPTDKSVSIVGDIDFLLFSDSSVLNTSYSLIDRTRNVNVIWDEAVSELYRADPNYKWDDTTNSDFPIATTDLESGTDHYVLLDSALVIHRFRVHDANGNFVTLEPIFRSEATDDELNGEGTPTKYYKIGGSVFPLPVPNYSSTAGVELEFQRGGNHFATTDTTTSPGFNSQFHQFLSVGAALRYAMANGMDDKANRLKAEKEEIRAAMVEHYQLRSPDERPKLSLKKNSVRHYGLSRG